MIWGRFLARTEPCLDLYGAPLPTSCLYSLSPPEREAMETFILDSLAAGIIWLSLWKTTFNTHLSHFVYLVMPFGLTAAFQAMANDVLLDFTM